MFTSTDRRRQIIDAATDEFATHGFHGARMEAIAARCMLTPGALYRHMPTKQALFTAVVDLLLEEFEGAVAVAGDETDPAAALAGIVAALVACRMGRRNIGFLGRWEERHLGPAERAAVHERLATATATVAGFVAALHPGEPDTDSRLRATAVLAACGSISDHRTAASTDVVSAILAGAAQAVVAAPLPRPQAPRARTSTPAEGDRAVPGPLGGGLLRRRPMREELRDAAIAQFGSRGYHETSLEDIARAVGIGPSALYRHVSGKQELLLWALEEVGNRGRELLAEIDPGAADPQAEVRRLAACYTEACFTDSAVLLLYLSSVTALEPADRHRVRSRQRDNVLAWSGLVARARGIDAVSARFLVHAALAVSVDLGRTLRFEPRQQQRVAALAAAILSGPGNTARS